MATCTNASRPKAVSWSKRSAIAAAASDRNRRRSIAPSVRHLPRAAPWPTQVISRRAAAGVTRAREGDDLALSRWCRSARDAPDPRGVLDPRRPEDRGEPCDDRRRWARDERGVRPPSDGEHYERHAPPGERVADGGALRGSRARREVRALHRRGNLLDEAIPGLLAALASGDPLGSGATDDRVVHRVERLDREQVRRGGEEREAEDDLARWERV